MIWGELDGARYGIPLWPAGLLFVALAMLLRFARPAWASLRAPLYGLLALLPPAFWLAFQGPDERFAGRAPGDLPRPEVGALFGSSLSALTMGLGLGFLLFGAGFGLGKPARGDRPFAAGLLLLLPALVQVGAMRGLSHLPELKLPDTRPTHPGLVRTVQPILSGLSRRAGWKVPPVDLGGPQVMTHPVRLQATHRWMVLEREVQHEVVAPEGPSNLDIRPGIGWYLVDAASGTLVGLRFHDGGTDGGLHWIRLERADGPMVPDRMRDLVRLNPDTRVWLGAGEVRLESGESLIRYANPSTPDGHRACAILAMPELTCHCGTTPDAGPQACVQEGLARSAALSSPLVEAALGAVLPGAGWEPTIFHFQRVGWAKPPTTP